MRSSTFYTLTEFANQLGIDPWRMAQINIAATDPGIVSGPSVKTGKCPCIEQNMSSDPGRDDFIRAIEFAETIFQLWTHQFVGLTSVLAERHNYNVGKNTMTWESVKPRHYPVATLGVYAHTLVAEDLATGIANPVPKTVTLTFSVPSGTTADELHVFFTEDDAGENVDPGERDWEIRPVKVWVDGTTATIQGDTYLFVNPDSYLQPGCLPNVQDSYVPQVNVYRRTVDTCQQGDFIYRGGGCDSPPCSETETPACFSDEGFGWYTPQFSTCENGIRTAYKPCNRPHAIAVNYITGRPLVKGRLDTKVAQIIFMLAVANADFDASFCCEDNARQRWERYQSYSKASVSERGGSSSYALLLSPEDMKRLQGLPPNLGNLTAYLQARALKQVVGVGTL